MAKKSDADVNEVGAAIVSSFLGMNPPKGVVAALKKRLAARKPAKNAAAAALGRLGGLKGGKARAEALSAKKRKEIAAKAARARWGKRETPSVGLTPQEARIVALVADGKSSGQIAAQLGVSLGTVKKSRDGLARKLGLSGKATPAAAIS